MNPRRPLLLSSLAARRSILCFARSTGRLKNQTPTPTATLFGRALFATAALIVQAGKRAKVSLSIAESVQAWDSEVQTPALADRKPDLKVAISQGLPWRMIAEGVRFRLLPPSKALQRLHFTSPRSAEPLRVPPLNFLLLKRGKTRRCATFQLSLVNTAKQGMNAVFSLTR